MSRKYDQIDQTYQNILNSIPDAVFVADPKTGTIIGTNTEGCRLLQHSHDNIIGMRQYELYPQIYWKQAQNIFRNHVKSLEAGGKTEPAIIPVQRADGSTVNVEIIASLTKIKHKTVILGVFRDITQRIQTETELYQQTELYRTLVNASPSVITLIDMGGKIIFASPSILSMAALKDIKEIIGRSPFDFIAPEDVERAQKHMHEVFQGRRTEHNEYSLVRADGTRIYGEITSALIYDRKGQPFVILSIIRDITDRKRTEIALRESEEKYRTIFETASVSIWEEDITEVVNTINKLKKKGVKDFKAYFTRHPEFIDEIMSQIKIIDCNEESVRLYEAKNKEHLIKNFLMTLMPAHKKLSQEIIEAIAGGQTSCEGETIHRTLNGKLLHLILKIKIPQLSQDSPQKLLVSLLDITNRVEMETALRESAQKYRHLVENANEAILIIQDQKPILINEKILEITGFSQSELQSLSSFFNLVYEEDRKWALDRYIRRMNNEDVPKIYELRIYQKNGAVCWIKFNAVRIIWENKPATLALLHDISEQKRTEKIIHLQRDLAFNLNHIDFLDTAIQNVVDTLLEIPGIDSSCFFLLDSNSKTLDLKYHKGFSSQFIQKIQILKTKPQVIKSSLLGHPVYCSLEKVSPYYRNVLRTENIQYIIILPIFHGKEVAGALHIFSKTVHDISQFEKDALETIATQFGGMIARIVAKDALKISEERLNLAVEAATDGVWDYNPVNGDAYFSPRWFTLLSYSPNEFPAQRSTWEKLLHPDDKDFATETLNEISRTGASFAIEFRMKTKDNRWLWIQSRGRGVEWDEQGRVSRIIGTHTDISFRKETEEALRLSETRFREIFEKSSDAICVLRENKIVLMNPAFEKLFQYPKFEYLSQSFEFLSLIAAEYRDYFMNLINLITSNKTIPKQVNFNAINKNQETIECNASLSEIHWDKQKAILCIIRDLSDIRKLESQFLHAQKMESIGRLAGGVAHDFNNLLTAIIGNSELAKLNLRESDPIYHDIEEIIKTANRATELTRQLLTFSRRQIITPQTIDLAIIIQEMERMLKRIIGEDIKLKTVATNKLWKIKADPSQIEQVVVNLVVNARDSMPHGGTLLIQTMNVEFEQDPLFFEPEITPGKYVCIVIADTGHGIEPQILPHIFEPFFTTKEKGQGTGLGLSTVYGIVTQNSGYIRVQSDIDVGTRFYIYFPAITKSTKTEKDTPTAKRKYGGDERILIVEDETIVRNMAIKSLETYGYRVVGVANGEEALETLSQSEKKFDLVLTDIIMPRINGWDLAKNLQKSFPKMKIVLMSGYSDHSSLSKTQSDDMLPFIQKPFKPSDLVLKIREVLDS